MDRSTMEAIGKGLTVSMLVSIGYAFGTGHSWAWLAVAVQFVLALICASVSQGGESR